MKKIAILFPFARENGACKVPCQHSQMFTKAGYYVDLIVRDDKTIFPYSGNMINLNVKSRNGLMKLLTYCELFFKIYKLKRKNNYDVFISHIPHCDLINVLTKCNELTITTVHTNNERRYSYLSNKLLGFVFLKSDYVVTVSEGLKDKLSNKYKKLSNKIIRIYNPINLNSINKESSVYNKKINSFGTYIINVGRLDIQKGQWHLIKAFFFLKKNKLYKDDLKLVIVGDGPEKKKLYKLCKLLDIEDDIIFTGFCSNPYSYIKNASLFVFPSLYEGFPIVLLEAMACGVPIISSDCKTGPRELLGYSEEYGMLLPDFGNPSGLSDNIISNADKMLASKICEVLCSSQLKEKFINNSHKKVKEFSEDNIVKYWEAIFTCN